MEPLIIGALAVLICLVALHVLDRKLEQLDAMRRQHEAALKRANLLQNLRRQSARRLADLTEPGDTGDEGGWPHRENAA